MKNEVFQWENNERVEKCHEGARMPRTSEESRKISMNEWPGKVVI